MNHSSDRLTSLDLKMIIRIFFFGFSNIKTRVEHKKLELNILWILTFNDNCLLLYIKSIEHVLLTYSDYGSLFL